MKALVLSTNDWVEVRAQLGIAEGTPIAIQNQSAYAVRLMEATSKPTAITGWIVLSQGDTDQWGGEKLWARSAGGGISLMVQEIEQ